MELELCHVHCFMFVRVLCSVLSLRLSGVSDFRWASLLSLWYPTDAASHAPLPPAPSRAAFRRSPWSGCPLRQAWNLWDQIPWKGLWMPGCRLLGPASVPVEGDFCIIGWKTRTRLTLSPNGFWRLRTSSMPPVMKWGTRSLLFNFSKYCSRRGQWDPNPEYLCITGTVHSMMPLLIVEEAVLLFFPCLLTLSMFASGLVGIPKAKTVNRMMNMTVVSNMTLLLADVSMWTREKAIAPRSPPYATRIWLKNEIGRFGCI